MYIHVYICIYLYVYAIFALFANVLLWPIFAKKCPGGGNYMCIFICTCVYSFVYR